MKKLLTTFLALLCLAINASEPGNDAIYAWVDGSCTCYKLEAMPKVKYLQDKAILSIDGKNVLELEITETSKLRITFGFYDETLDPTGVQTLESSLKPVNKQGKYIKGGKLFVVKNGKLYDINGIEIKS